MEIKHDHEKQNCSLQLLSSIQWNQCGITVSQLDMHTVTWLLILYYLLHFHNCADIIIIGSLFKHIELDMVYYIEIRSCASKQESGKDKYKTWHLIAQYWKITFYCALLSSLSFTSYSQLPHSVYSEICVPGFRKSPRREGLPAAMIALIVYKMRFLMRQVSVRLIGEIHTYPQCSVVSKQMKKFYRGTVEINSVHFFQLEAKIF